MSKQYTVRRVDKALFELVEVNKAGPDRVVTTGSQTTCYRHRARLMGPRITLKERVLAELGAKPQISNQELQQAVPEACRQYISELRRQHGYPVYRTSFHTIGTKNRLWLLNESKRIGVGPQIIIDALLTDARLEKRKGS